MFTKRTINASDAKKNYKKYLKSLSRMREVYKKNLCKEIKRAALCGKTNINTVDLHYDFMSYDFMMNDLKLYFEQKGFKVTEKSNRTGVLTSWLNISWYEEE